MTKHLYAYTYRYPDGEGHWINCVRTSDNYLHVKLIHRRDKEGNANLPKNRQTYIGPIIKLPLPKVPRKSFIPPWKKKQLAKNKK
jgi:hypothetical protein